MLSQILLKTLKFNIHFLAPLTWIACTSPHNTELLGSKAFKFNPKQVIEVSLTKSDSNTSDHWSITLHRDPAPDPRFWEFTSPPLNLPMLDRLADETFIAHLLDLLQNVQMDALAPRGALDTYGLNPPQFAIRWVTPEKSWEFRLGAYSPASANKTQSQSGVSTAGYFISLDGKTIYIARSPAFTLLQMIDSVQFIRRNIWTKLTPDDVDEIQIFIRGKQSFYAQREGDRWTNSKHQMIKKNLEAPLQQLVLARTQEFIDDPDLAQSVKKNLENHFNCEVRINDRHGHSTTLKIWKINKKTYGMNSTRLKTLFILNATVLQICENFHQH